MEDRPEVAALPRAVRAEIAVHTRHRRRIGPLLTIAGAAVLVLGVLLHGVIAAGPRIVFLGHLTVGGFLLMLGRVQRRSSDPVEAHACIGAQYDRDETARAETPEA